MAFHNVPPNGFPDLPDVEELEAVQKDVQNLKTMKAAKADIAPEFSATSNYAVGDMVYHDGTLYKCTTVHEAAAWNADHFAAATIGAEISAVKGDVSDLEETKANQITIAPFFSAETAYEVGDIVYYNGLSYRCTNAHDGEWDAADFAATTVAGELSELNSNINGIGNKVDKIATSGIIWFPITFDVTSHADTYFASLNSLPAHTTATLSEVNELGIGALTLSDFTLVANDEHSLSYITTTNSAHAGKIYSAKITFA